MSQIEEEQKQEELRRAQAALLEKQEKNDKKKENEEFLDRLVISVKTVVIGFIRGIFTLLYCVICLKESSYKAFDLHGNELLGETHFQEWFCTNTRFDTGVKGNLEMAYW